MLKQAELIHGERTSGHLAGTGEVGHDFSRECRALGDGKERVCAPHAAAEPKILAQRVLAEAPHRGVAMGTAPAVAASQVQMGHAAAVDEAVVGEAAADPGDSAQHAESSALGPQFSVRASSSLGRGDIHHPAHGMRAVQRGSRAPNEFDPLGTHEIHVRVERRCVSLGAGRIPKAQAIYQHGCVMVTQAPRLHGGEAAGTAQLPDADPWDHPQGLPESELVPVGNLARADGVQRLRDLAPSQRRARRGHDDLDPSTRDG